MTKINGYSRLHRIRTPATLVEIRPENAENDPFFAVFSIPHCARINIDGAFGHNLRHNAANGGGLVWNIRVQLQGMAANLLSPRTLGEGISEILLREAEQRRDRLHLLPDAERENDRRMESLYS